LKQKRRETHLAGIPNPAQSPIAAEFKLRLIDGKERSFLFRSNHSSDRNVIRQIFIDRDYSLSHFKQTQSLKRFASSAGTLKKNLLVIDAGANIGASAIYFTQLDSRIHVCAIEPEPSNFNLLERNCAGMPVSSFQAALSAEREELWISDPGLSHWGYRVGPGGGHSKVSAFSVLDILENFPADKYLPAICKIDIEGGEQRLFSRNDAWLDLFPLIIIELHDWMLPGTASSGNFLRAIGRRNFDVINFRENLFCFNNNLIL
jgi:FkbM family methyltransferase